MTRPFHVLYVGHQPATLAALRERLAHLACDVCAFDDRTCSVQELVADWRQLLMLDVDVTKAHGFRLLRDIKEHHAGIPVIVLCDAANHALTQMAVARRNGAEGALFQPIDKNEYLLELVQSAFRRLARWQQALALYRDRQLEEESSACEVGSP